MAKNKEIKEDKKKKRKVRKVRTEEPISNGRKIIAPKTKMYLSKKDRERIKQAKKDFGFEEFFKKGRYKGKRRCLWNKGSLEEPDQCKLPGYKQGKYVFCARHGKHLTYNKVSSDLVLQNIKRGKIYNLGNGRGALQEQIQSVDMLCKDDMESLDNEIRLLVATIRNYLENNDNETIARYPNNLRLLIETLINAKKLSHDMKYGKQFSFTIDMVNYMVFQIKSIITKSITDVEVLKKITDEFKILSIEVKNREF